MSKYCPNVQPDASSGYHKRSRIRVACLHCRDKKLKCDGKFPCSTCGSKGSDCHYQKPDTSDASQEISASAAAQRPLSDAVAPLDRPGGLATPASTSVYGVPGSSSCDSVVDPYVVPGSDQMLASTENWNFDWMTDMEMNDFSVRRVNCHS